MADTVRYLMEEMIPELEDLERKGYFTKQELKQIVKKREDFEYKLKRRATLKQDYLRYIEFEDKLNDLRKLRRKALGVVGKKTVADYAMVRRIHFVYQRATRKFPGDVSLWMSWLEYCKASKSDKQFSRAVTKALQLHPTHSGIWSYAAAWEFEHNGNPGAARALMQQGLRMCKHDEGLWVEYFKMELHYVHKMRTRRQVLGLDNPDAPPGTTDIATNSSAMEAVAEDGAVAEEESAAPGAAVAAVLTGGIAGVAARAAVAALPHSLALRRGLLDALAPFSFPGTSELREQLYVGLERDMPQSEEAWELLARRHCPDPSASPPPQEHAAAAAIATYQRALEARPTSAMFRLFTSFMRQLVQSLGAQEGTVERAAAAAKQLLDLHAQAHRSGACTAELYGEWARVAGELRQTKAARRALSHGCQKFPESAALWRQRIELEAAEAPTEGPSSSGGDAGEFPEGLRQVVQQALSSVRGDDMEQLWLNTIQLFGASARDLRMLQQQLVTVLLGSPKGPLRGGLGAVAAALVAAVQQLLGLEQARELYTQLMKLPAAGGQLHMEVIRMEHGQLPAGGGRSWAQHGEQVARVQRLFDAAVEAYGHLDTELWLEFARFETEARGGAGTVYWRATKALEDPEEFIHQYRELLGLE